MQLALVAGAMMPNTNHESAKGENTKPTPIPFRVFSFRAFVIRIFPDLANFHGFRA
jgi:hypothetical protein